MEITPHQFESHPEVHPHKTVMQRCSQGVDFLGAIVFPHYKLTRQRSVRALRQRLAGFTELIFGRCGPGTVARECSGGVSGAWHKWLSSHRACSSPGVPTAALLQKMLATLNSYYGMYGHANTWHLRKHIYEVELGLLRQFFIPEGPGYRHLRIRKVWLLGPGGP